MNRNFKGVWIPKEIWIRNELTPTDRCLLAEIDSLDNGKGCFAGNEYFAEFFGLSVNTISRSVTKMKNLKLIDTEMRKIKTGRQRVIKLVKRFSQHWLEGSPQIGDNPSPQIGEHNNTPSFNNTVEQQGSLFTDEKKGSEKKKKVPHLPEVVEYFLKNGYTEVAAKKAFEYYNTPMVETNGKVWKDSNQNTVRNWKQKMRGVWFRDEFKISLKRDLTKSESYEDMKL